MDEAIFAARGLSDDPEAQAQIAASLIGAPLEKVRVAVLKNRQRKDVTTVTFSRRSGTERAVVVERKTPRRLGAPRRLG